MEFASNILNQINFPLVGYTIGMVYVAILVPTAIKLFSDKKEFEILDRNVILDHVVRARSLLLFLGMIFVPPIFWDILSWPTTRLIEIAVWGG